MPNNNNVDCQLIACARWVKMATINLINQWHLIAIKHFPKNQKPNKSTHSLIEHLIVQFKSDLLCWLSTHLFYIFCADAIVRVCHRIKHLIRLTIHEIYQLPIYHVHSISTLSMPHVLTTYLPIEHSISHFNIHVIVCIAQCSVLLFTCQFKS